jgi:hypothetical protein
MHELRKPHVHAHIHTGFGAVEPDIGALRNERSHSRAVPAAAAAAPSSNAVQQRMSSRSSPEPVPSGGGGIEIPAFLKRRRLQGK